MTYIAGTSLTWGGGLPDILISDPGRKVYFFVEMLGALWPALVGLLVLLVLGAPLAWLMGLRKLWLCAVTPAFAMTVISVATVLSGWLGVAWTILPALITMIVIGGLIILVRALAGVRPTPSVRSDGIAKWTIGTLAVVAIVLTVQVSMVIGAPEAISQTFDNVFHLNAIRYITDTGIVSPLQIGQMTSPNGGVAFYPSEWHAFAALIVQLSGAGVALAINAQTLIISAVIWPLGAVLLARVLIGSSRSVTVASGIISAAVPAFPLLPMDYGVLYPYQLALALLPVALAATASAFQIGWRDLVMPWWWWCVVAIGTIPGLAGAHPGGFVGWLALSFPMVVWSLIRLWRSGTAWRNRLLPIVLLIGYGMVGIALLKLLRPPLPTRQWPTVLDLPSAVGSALSVQLYYNGAAWLVAASVVLGLYWTIRERRAGPLIAATMWLIGGALFVIVIASTWGTLRDALTGSWYNNWPRLASLFAIALLPIAAFGLACTGKATLDFLFGVLRLRAAPVTRAVLTVGAAVIALCAFNLTVMPVAMAAAHASFVMNAKSPLLSDDELTLLKRLDDVVPEGTTIAGNPYTGAGLAYAISGRDVLMRHILVEVSEETAEINDHLTDADDNAAVCQAIEDLDAWYVLDFGKREVHGGSNPLPGLVDLEHSSAVRLIDSEGDAKLYEVVACGRQ